LHIDKGICVSHGWVFSRTKEVWYTFCDFSPNLHVLQIHRKESNFVYSDYKLIVELSYDCHWFWNAAEDAHGTTTNQLTMSKPVRWKDGTIHMLDKAQWTSAQMIPLAVASASLRNSQPDNIWWPSEL
jgi:hypothetical protein